MPVVNPLSPPEVEPCSSLDLYTIERIQDRMKTGKEKYGHGLISSMDTRTWGTKENSWLEMAEEEYLDALVYVSADYIRSNNLSDRHSEDDNDLILKLISEPELIKSKFHKDKILLLNNLVKLGRIRYHQQK